jgi:hypothetical protein
MRVSRFLTAVNGKEKDSVAIIARFCDSALAPESRDDGEAGEGLKVPEG